MVALLFFFLIRHASLGLISFLLSGHCVVSFFWSGLRVFSRLLSFLFSSFLLILSGHCVFFFSSLVGNSLRCSCLFFLIFSDPPPFGCGTSYLFFLLFLLFYSLICSPQGVLITSFFYSPPHDCVPIYSAFAANYVFL